ncbi:MAG: hypothetical protein ABW195_12700 [Ilumatobacteraceae bacterium]
MTSHGGRRPSADSGASLILAIAFVLVVGMISAGLVGLTTSSLSNRNTLQSIRNRQYDADAAIELAIDEARGDTCATAGRNLDVLKLNTVAIRVEWTNVCSVFQTVDGTVVGQRNVVFSACEGESTCNPATSVLRAVVNFRQAGGDVTMTVVQSWSVDR